MNKESEINILDYFILGDNIQISIYSNNIAGDSSWIKLIINILFKIPNIKRILFYDSELTFNARYLKKIKNKNLSNVLYKIETFLDSVFRLDSIYDILRSFKVT